LGAVLRLALAALIAAIPLKTPYPPPNAGSGNEPTAGVGRGAGLTFRPHFALATYNAIAGTYVLYLTQKRVACTSPYTASIPYLTVTIVTAGSPLAVGRATPNRGEKDYVQVGFYVARTHYYSIQPGVRLVLTRTTPKKGGLWHGRLTVPKTQITNAASFSFKGSFAARWCGRT
jgi:hypothetical protein